MNKALHIALTENLAMASKALGLAVDKLESAYGLNNSLAMTLWDTHSEITDFVILMHDVLEKEHPDEPNHYKDLYYKIITADKPQEKQ